MEHFTPISAVVGGVLIGLAAAMLWLGLGRIAGISGILGALLRPQPGDIAWRLAFLAGLVLATPLFALAGGAVSRPIVSDSAAVVIAGAFLVGFGTRLGSGCTSGHGVCGIARLSRRSIVATLIFMAGGFATVFVVRHLIGA